ncbi:glycoside hydrolase superfamily [Pseudomassariella vexata]|uniref:Glycoside hydrolase superfamily n=1 Tax=Pseudomassariella vexata TaxID=1141098 RepID=A0A1Y2DN81_9PEZI|nr:glycoside hydrolase superfamily [Pseudomassariella vexata]ORY60732.1 glycoside hydrolase superfamily [Pseudomassariella vexata]
MSLFTVSLAIASLLQLSTAQPRRRHQVHQHPHRRAFLPKRAKLTVTDTTFTKPTEVPEVVVYVDQYGNLVSTETETIVIVPASTAPAEVSSEAPNPPSPVATLASPVPPTVESGAEQPTTAIAPAPAPSAGSVPEKPTSISAPASAVSNTTPTQSAEPDPAVSQNSKLYGVTYSPYKGIGGCKTATEVEADFALFAKDYGLVRIYGVDCDQVATAYAAAKKYGNKLMLGIFDISSIDQAVSTMAKGIQGDWSMVEMVSVGNELVNNGAATVSQILAAVGHARSGLRAAGYQGPVATVDTFVAAIANPELCNNSDVCTVNVHPFFDPHTSPDQAGAFITSTISRLRNNLSDSNKRIMVTETGWPWHGKSNGLAVPGMDHQATALSSIKSAFSDKPADLILFTAFNDLWKKPEMATFNAEQFWGMGGLYSPADK